MDRVFLDANILFSAAYRPDAGLLKLWKLNSVELVSSTYALKEARANLPQREQRARLERLTGSLKILPHVPVNHPLPVAVNLPAKDRPILIGAIEAKATHLLTGDVAHFGSYYGQTVGGVLILRPAAYLRGHAFPEI